MSLFVLGLLLGSGLVLAIAELHRTFKEEPFAESDFEPFYSFGIVKPRDCQLPSPHHGHDPDTCLLSW